MKVRVVADADWLPELDAHLQDVAVVDRTASVDAADFDADVLVAPMAAAESVLAAFEKSIPVPAVWVVPKEARRPELERLSEAAPSHRFVFGPDAPAVAEACRDLATGDAGGDGDADGGGGTAPRTPAPDRASASMAQLWEQFRGTMLERLDVLEDVGADVLSDDAAEDRLEEAHHAAHKLHGSLGTFGLHRGSELASELEALVEDGMAAGTMDPGSRYRYSELVVGLRREIEAGRPAATDDQKPDGPEEPGDASGAVLIIDSEPDRLEKLRAAAVARGWRPSRGATAVEALEWLEGGERPLLAVLDPAAGDPESLEALLDRLAGGADPVPVIFQGRTRTLDERLQAVTLGARVFVDREASAGAIMGRADSLLAAERPGEARILAVDDDPGVLRILTFILRGAGFAVHTLDSPLEFWGTLEAVEPDMVLLDVLMPGVSGYQLCRAIRADPRWGDLPILFLTARSAPEDVIAGFEAGGDDFVVKPVAGPELLARIENRLARRRSATATGADRGTGLPSRAAARERLEMQVAVAERHDEFVTVALVRLEGAEPSELDREVSRLADRLRKEARPEDIVARWSKDEVLVTRYGEDAGATHRWLDRHLPTGAARTLVGLATHPDDGTGTALLERAQADLKAEDRRHGVAKPVEVGKVDADIVIVEDDEALGTLLTRTLDERGYNTHWVRDGAEAADLLTGEEPAMRASLIILDVGLPGLDGLSLLRRLGRDGITRRTRVLMLTARSAESEVVKALELGAFDHVPKPFSVSELIHRVRRALGDRGGP